MVLLSWRDEFLLILLFWSSTIPFGIQEKEVSSQLESSSKQSSSLQNVAMSSNCFISRASWFFLRLFFLHDYHFAENNGGCTQAQLKAWQDAEKSKPWGVKNFRYVMANWGKETILMLCFNILDFKFFMVGKI